MPVEFKQHVLERSGCPIHYWLGVGNTDGTLLVFLHGALLDHHMFEPQYDELAGSYRLLTWDARGHGLSQPIGLQKPKIEDYVSDLHAVLAELGTPEVVLIAQSMGAYIAQHYARLHPQRVRGLTIIGAAPIALPLSSWDIWLLQVSLPSFKYSPYGWLTEQMARSITLHSQVSEYTLTSMRKLDKTTFLGIWHAVVSAVRQKGYTDFKPSMPVLLTHGASDNTGSIRRDSPRWAKQAPEIEYVVIPEAGHNANQDNPAFFNPLLLDWLNRLHN